MARCELGHPSGRASGTCRWRADSNAVITDPLTLLALITLGCGLAFWLDRNVLWMGKLGASLLTIIFGAALSNTGLVPVTSPVYDAITGPVTSLAVAWLLLSINLSDVKRAGPKMLTAFGIAVTGTAVGAFVGALVFAGVFGEDMWRLAGTLTGTYAGGGLNFAAVSQSVELPASLFAGTAAADNLTTGLWLGVTLTLPLWLGRWFPAPIPGSSRDRESGGQTRAPVLAATGSPSVPDAVKSQSSSEIPSAYAGHPFDQKAPLSALGVSKLLAAGIGLLLLSELCAQLIPAVPSILWLSTLALMAGHTPWFRKLPGAFQFGTVALHLFFVVIGIFSRVSEIMVVGVEVFWLTLVIVGIHGVWTFGVGRLFNIDVGTLAVASQAAIGGPSSALAVAVGRDWQPLILPGIVVGLMGYALGNYVGIGVAYLVQALSIGL